MANLKDLFTTLKKQVSTLLEDADAYERMSRAVNPYGDGKACSRIVRTLKGEPVDRYAAGS